MSSAGCKPRASGTAHTMVVTSHKFSRSTPENLPGRGGGDRLAACLSAIPVEPPNNVAISRHTIRGVLPYTYILSLVVAATCCSA